MHIRSMYVSGDVSPLSLVSGKPLIELGVDNITVTIFGKIGPFCWHQSPSFRKEAWLNQATIFIFQSLEAI